MLVDLSYSERARERFPGEARLFPIQNAGHGFKRQEDMLAMQAVRQFLLGREEVLTVDVHLTDIKRESKGIDSVVTLPFDGAAGGPYFEGVIQPGAASEVGVSRRDSRLWFMRWFGFELPRCAAFSLKLKEL